MNPLGEVLLKIGPADFHFVPTWRAIVEWESITNKSTARLITNWITGDLSIKDMVDILYSAIDHERSVNMTKDKFAQIFISSDPTTRIDAMKIAGKLLGAAHSGRPMSEIDSKKKEDPEPKK